MQQQSVTLQNPTGLHARPGRQLVELAKKFNINTGETFFIFN